jgi:Planctomycete cytochrome C
MWGGVVLAAAAWLCWILRARTESGGSHTLYMLTLVAAVGLVSFTGYRGGQLAQGENHLTELMPEPLQAALGVSASEPVSRSGNGGPGTFYGARIQPLFASHCTICHGRNRHKGKLGLDSFDALMRGGKHGAVVKANETKASELFRRITLPQTDDEFMPTDNKRPLSASDVKLIELWIASGASGTQPVDAIKDAPFGSTSQVPEVTFEEIDAAAVAKQREDFASIVTQLQQRFPRLLDYESRSSADIVVNASLMGSKFGDQEVAALSPLSNRVVVADFSNTAITDRSASILGSMKHLRTLRLMHTKITDATIQGLGSLEQLESLSLFDSPVTPANLPLLARLPKLHHIYVTGTRVRPDAPLPQEVKDKLVF